MIFRTRLDDLPRRDLNFEPADPERIAEEAGWRHDDHRQPLADEPPGEPVPGAAWEVACRLSREYEFADPAMVRAVFDVDAPLPGRNMLLELRFLGLRLRVGCRVGGVVDELRNTENGPARVWAWDYLTLEGHVEEGRRFFEVWKHLDSGAVEFRTHSYSRPAFRNPVLRYGFLLLARRRQREFGLRACRRMAQLTAEELSRASRSP